MELQNPSLIVAKYLPVIAAFKKRYDVQNGTALGYRQNQDPNGELKFENTPKGIGDGLATTGWCVSASQALLLDNIFQILIKDRSALAKLVSIDIKEQYYGKTYSGNQNKWHTAILVKDSGYNFIIDITCKQFGNAFVDKDVWDFKTWESTFRSPADKHKIIGFDNDTLNFMPVQTVIVNKTVASIEIENTLHDITTITDSERKTIVDFFMEKIQILNQKLIIGNINKFDFKYLTEINKLLENLDFETKKQAYHVMEFPTKDAALEWIKIFFNNDCILQQYLIISDTIEKSCNYFGLNSHAINIESQKNTTYIVFDFSNVKGIDVSFLEKNVSLCIPYGIKLFLNQETDIFNGGKLLGNAVGEIEKKSNTIYIKCDN